MGKAKDNRTAKGQGPEKLTGLRTGTPKESAAGLDAIRSSGKHLFGAMPPRRGIKALKNLNQHQGIDCPGCAWPDPDDERSWMGEYCENGAKAIAEEATTKRLEADFFKENSISDLRKLSDYELGKKGRIAQPLYLPEGGDHYEEIGWDSAFKKIAKHLKSLKDPNQAIFYTSGRTSNEAAFLYQLFVREYGTNNLPDCSNMCHESSGVALSETLGIGKGTVKLEDFYKTEVILILGQNPGTNHPRMLSALQKAKKNGARIVVVNPLKEAGLLNFSNPQQVGGILGGKTKLADHYLQLKINSDMALLQAIAKLLLIREDEQPGLVLDHDFIHSKTYGYESYIKHLKKLNLDDLVSSCGVPREQLDSVVDQLSKSRKIIACWAMGLTQHKNSVNTIKEIVNLLLLKGSIGKPGAGTCPVRGHSNVQGDRTMGIHENPPKRFLDQLETVFGIEAPRPPGHNTVSGIEAMHAEKAKVFLALGGNFLSAAPDTEFTAEALSKCSLTTHVSTKLNRSHLIHGKEALILPCLARTDRDKKNGEARFVSVENSMGVVHSSMGTLKPVSEKLLSEPDIVCGLAKEVLPSSRIPWNSYLEDYDHIRHAIERCIPGFENYNERVRERGGFYLPNGARDNKYITLTGKANFSISQSKTIHLENDELLMMTIRSHDQFNTTIYGLNDRYRGIYNERRVILMNPQDVARLGFEEGAVVDLRNQSDGRVRIVNKFIIVPYDIPQQCAATYFPEANALVSIKSTADKSHTPTSKSVVISISPHQRN